MVRGGVGLFVRGAIGFAYGWIGKQLKLEEGLFPKKDIIRFNVLQVISHLVVRGVLAPVLDILIYSERRIKFSHKV